MKWSYPVVALTAPTAGARFSPGQPVPRGRRFKRRRASVFGDTPRPELWPGALWFLRQGRRT